MPLPNTHFGYEHLKTIFNKKCKIFFDGIGGVSVSSLASIAKIRGHEVLGYDKIETEITRKLEADGIKVYYESRPENIDGCDALVYTVAMPEDNAEYNEARIRNIPTISRADFLGYIMSDYKTRIGVSGMHGKSTTTAMLESIFTNALKEPTVSCGAKMNSVENSYVIGKDELFIFEACEYKDSFLDFYPSIAIVLNIEMEHVDFFKSIEQARTSYYKFIAKTGDNGVAVLNADDNNVNYISKYYTGKIVKFGIKRDNVDFKALNVSYNQGCVSFDIKVTATGEIVHVQSNYPGNYIVTDALAAFATAYTYGLDTKTIADGIFKYPGIGRRMQKCGKTKKGANVYSDYAHHPTEIVSTLATVSEMDFKKSICVFQPHTYSRLSELFEKFVAALAESTMDEIVVTDVYAAREINEYGVSSNLLKQRLVQSGKEAVYIEDKDLLVSYLLKNTSEGDLIFVMGAGDINDIVPKLLED